eukprot:4576924-Pleurochrysis_carterae.AAC.1
MEIAWEMRSRHHLAVHNFRFCADTAMLRDADRHQSVSLGSGLPHAYTRATRTTAARARASTREHARARA